MYAAFNLSGNPPENFFSSYHFLSKATYIVELRDSFRQSLKPFVLSDKSLSAQKIEDEWFPEVNAHVFISHSHKDEQLAMNLAIWLKENLKLSSFIDSTVWGYVTELQKQIDDKYCYQEGSNTYSYEKRNYSTAHVHMILNTALMKMLDKADIVIFLNTPQSISLASELDTLGYPTTSSPWIYSELTMTKFLRKKSFRRTRIFTGTAMLENLEVKYPAPLEHLTTLTWLELASWKERVERVAGQSMSLDDKLNLFYDISNV